MAAYGLFAKLQLTWMENRSRLFNQAHVLLELKSSDSVVSRNVRVQNAMAQLSKAGEPQASQSFLQAAQLCSELPQKWIEGAMHTQPAQTGWPVEKARWEYPFHTIRCKTNEYFKYFGTVSYFFFFLFKWVFLVLLLHLFSISCQSPLLLLFLP